MPAVSSFNTTEVRAWDQPVADTLRLVNLPQTYVALPRLSVGLNQLDIEAGTNVRCRGYTTGITNRTYTAHLNTWGDTTLYSGGINILILKPADLAILSGEFSTTDDHPWENPQPETKRRIDFERPFASPPKVVVYLREIDAGSGSSVRVRTYVTDVDAQGFTIHIDTWGDTQLFSGGASWVAYPEDMDYIASGTANTSDVRLWAQPQAHNSNGINFHFGGIHFGKNPQVFVALNSVDISSSKNFRIKAWGSDASPTGFTWHIDSWGDTILYSAGISYIALN
ncbi:hypothetical protein B0H14DRAFT_2687759 [Mycena olivaceomarginata]|nr:hypothetical protein B0H14DRAFT_2687759 [Mycena olivaceomarginata]